MPLRAQASFSLHISLRSGGLSTQHSSTIYLEDVQIHRLPLAFSTYGTLLHTVPRSPAEDRLFVRRMYTRIFFSYNRLRKMDDVASAEHT